MANVLVFPCGSEIGLEIHRALRDSRHITLFGASSASDHGEFVYERYVGDLPHVDAPNFIDALNRVIEAQSIQFVVPAHDAGVLRLAENQALLKATVVTSAVETCRVCRSKRKTYELFAPLMPTPAVYQRPEEMRFPLFLKPDVGQGSRGTFTANTRSEADFYLAQDPALLALEYLPGPEFTVDCFSDQAGELRFAAGRERTRTSNGVSVRSHPVDDARFHTLATIINRTLSLRGVWFFQVKERANGELALLEIAPRVAGGMALFRACGVNFILLSIFDRLGFDVEVLYYPRDIVMDRALVARYECPLRYEHVYIDFDDTIVLANAVNTEIMKFLYQAKNAGKKIVLLSRHRRGLRKALRASAISELLFDEIHVLRAEEEKSSYISHSQAIFIDDSFAERKKIWERHAIPVFALDAVEALLTWKA